jgi:hypothetical protein
MYYFVVYTDLVKSQVGNGRDEKRRAIYRRHRGHKERRKLHFTAEAQRAQRTATLFKRLKAFTTEHAEDTEKGNSFSKTQKPGAPQRHKGHKERQLCSKG